MPTFAALGKSGWPRMGYPFSLGQRFICADKLQYALQKWVWPAGHLLSRRRERRQRGAKGTPLEPWMVLSAFFLGKPPQRGQLNHPLYKKGLPPRDQTVNYQARVWGRRPLCTWLFQTVRFEPAPLLRRALICIIHRYDGGWHSRYSPYSSPHTNPSTGRTQSRRSRWELW